MIGHEFAALLKSKISTRLYERWLLASHQDAITELTHLQNLTKLYPFSAIMHLTTPTYGLHRQRGPEIACLLVNFVELGIFGESPRS